MDAHGYGIWCERNMENDIIAAHIVCAKGGGVAPVIKLKRAETVDEIGYMFRCRIEWALVRFPIP